MSYQKQTALPLPDSEAIHHSKTLQSLIRQQLQKTNAMPFSEYMAMVLYHPQYGYYMSEKQKFGADGDFTTAPELSPLFSRCLAMQCQQILNPMKNGAILEMGAGSGIMAAEILLVLKAMQCLPVKYYIYEYSEALRARQRQTLQQRCPDLLQHVIWLSDLTSFKFQGVVLANELLDAMPVERFKIAEHDILQAFVVYEADAFKLIWQPTENPALKEYVQQLQSRYELPTGYQSEVNLGLSIWCKMLDSCLQQGIGLLIDYGYTQKEYYHPQRMDGTFRCFYQHRAHADPFWYPGLQDLTAHVDFTALAFAADTAGFDILAFTSQAHFLMNCGLTSLSEITHKKNGEADPVLQFKTAQQIKNLVFPSEMGELFKVLAIGKHNEEDLLGFRLYNLLERL